VVRHGFAHGAIQVIGVRLPARMTLLAALSAAAIGLAAQELPPKDAFQILSQEPAGPRITPYLRYQLDLAWRQDQARSRKWVAIREEQELLKLQQELRKTLLEMIGGLPAEKTDLHPEITGKIQRDGYTIEKLIFQSLPGVYVTALVYSPDDRSRKHPAVLVPAGHATNGKIHYQGLSQRLAKRGYVVIAWDPVGQGERSQFWNDRAARSRYNLVCAEHAVLGNLAYLAGANLARWEIWDGMRAVDYLLTRPDVDAERINITGTSGGGTQTALIAALDPRIKAAVPSCYISSLPMRMANRIFVDPDSDPEQDLYGMVSGGVDHVGLLMLMYPRPVMVASAVLDFFPIEGARKAFREAQSWYEKFGHGDRIAMVEGYHKHEYSAENQEAALIFLDRFNGMPMRTGLAEPSQLPDRDLLCTVSGQVMVDKKDARSLTDVIREYYAGRKPTAKLKLATDYRKAERPGTAEWGLAEFTGAPAYDRQILWESLGTTKVGGILVDKFVLHHSKYLTMPLLFIHQASNEKREALLWLGETGKATPADWGELQKRLREGYDIVTFDFRGMGETRMLFTANSPDDSTLGKLDLDEAYASPISGVLANYVYNSLLTGRPYFYQMVEDVEIARRFAKEKLQVNMTAVTASGANYTLASAVSELLPGVKLLTNPDAKVLRWSDLVEQKQEQWPIQFLVPSGAYIH
jgi:pimeloyl-ACP methyl ester carboxylesterase